MTQLVPPDTLAQISTLLSNLPSVDNDIRSQAEQQLNERWVATQPDLTTLGLAQLISQSREQDLRAFASVLLRRIAFKHITHPQNQEEYTVWEIIQDSSRKEIKAALLIALANETIPTVRHKVCDTIAEVAKVGNGDGGEKWQELLQALFECSKSPSAEHRESAFRIFASVPNLISGQHIDGLKSVFAANLADPTSQGVRIQALKAAVAFLLQADGHSRNSFGELMPQMLDVLTPFLAQRDEDNLFDGMVVLIDFAESLPRLFKPVLPSVVAFMVTVMKDKGLENRTRQTALELLLTLAESSPAMIRKQPEFCLQVIPIALDMMADLTDDERWYRADDRDDDNDENYVTGEHAMDRLARYLGPKAVLPISFQLIPVMLGSEHWQQRHAALMAISAIGEGCQKLMQQELGKIIQLVVPYFRDPHPRVRYATCNAIGQMSTDFAPILQKQFHEYVLNTLIPVMDDAAHPRVQAHAAAALVNFCEAVDKAILEPYLDVIFERLLVLLNTGKTYVQEQAITTIATVADSAQDRFIKYHTAIMPLLLNVLRQATAKQYRLLRGKAMECASLIAIAVGREVFGPFSKEFIELLRQTQLSVTESDDPQISYLLASWARVCKVLGPEFIPYLDVVMPPLLASAQLKPDFAVVDPDDDIESKYSAEDGWEFVGVEGQQIGIKTTVLEEKCTAVEMLICYARELGAGFQPYVDQVLNIVLPLLKFYFHDGVRHAAACTIPQLLICAQKANAPADYIGRMWQTICENLVKAILTEADPSFLLQLYMTLYECVDTMGDNCMSTTELDAFTKATGSQLKDFYERVKRREQLRLNQELDAEDVEAQLEEEATEEAVLNELSHAIHSIFKTHRATYLPHFESILEIVITFLNDNNSSSKQWALCVLDDLIEFTGPQSWVYHNHFMERMIQYLQDPAPDVRQAAAYGIGVCAQFGGENYSDVCARSIKPLFEIITATDARSQDNLYATENAVSAITKICCFNSSKFDVNSILPAWFAALPIIHDDQEAPITYSYLMDLLDSQNAVIATSANIPHLINIFVDALSSGILSEPIVGRMVNGFKAILSGIPPETQAALWNSIQPEKRMTLQEKGYL